MEKAPFDLFAARARQLYQEFPHIAAQQAVHFFERSFDLQGFTNRIFIRWKPRQTASLKPGGGKKRDTNTGARLGQPLPNGARAILVKSGAMRRSIREQSATDGQFTIAAGGGKVTYAAAHNQGVHGPVEVGAHVRRIYSRQISYATSLKTHKVRRTSKRVLSATVEVKAFIRKANLPRRQFMGFSEVLLQQLWQDYLRRLSAAKRA